MITKFPKTNSADIARRKQVRDENLERIEKNNEFPVFNFKAFGFRPYFNNNDKINIKGPLCLGSLSKDRQCLAELRGDNAESKKAHCIVCGRTYDLPHGFQEFREIANEAYDGFVNSQAEIITLDVPYEAIKAEDEDETRKIRIKWSQKDGRNQAVIYFINKDDTGGEKAQTFVDMDREEIRHDSSDMHPDKYLVKITAEFKSTNVGIEYKKKEE